MRNRPAAPDPQDPLWQAILEESAQIDDAEMAEDVALLREMAEEAVAPYADILTDKALDGARYVAVESLVTHPDVDQILERRRRHLADKEGSAPEPPPRESSGTRAKLPSARLEAAQRRRGGGGGAA